MKSYIVEFIGTFFLLLGIGLSVIEPGAGTMAPLAIGSILMVMVYAGGHISGAHYNPAVTLAVFMRGKCKIKDVPFYMLAQVLGAVLASVIAIKLKGNPFVTAIAPQTVPALLAEFIFTFGLAYVILNVATAKGTAGNSFYGLAIGFTVMASAYSIGNISGCVLNPAVALGGVVMGLISISNIWIYLVANFSGAALAAVVFKMINKE